MKSYQRTLHLWIFLFLALSTPVMGQTGEHIGGYAQVNRLYADGYEGVRVNVKTPFYPMEDVLISMTLSIKTRDGHGSLFCLIPRITVCSKALFVDGVF